MPVPVEIDERVSEDVPDLVGVAVRVKLSEPEAEGVFDGVEPREIVAEGDDEMVDEGEAEPVCESEPVGVWVEV